MHLAFGVPELHCMFWLEQLCNPRLERKVEGHEQCFHKVFFACILLSRVQGSRRDDQVYETVVYPASERELLPTPKN